jgi:methionine-rich copper-binding protein CopC
MKSKTIRYSLVVLLAFLLVFAAGVTLAHAHAEVVASEPNPGAQLSESPGQIRLTFSEPVEPQSSFKILDTKFNTLEGVNPQIDPEHPEQVYSSVRGLDPGVYTVQWNAVTDDGGKTSGSFQFAVVETSSLRPTVLVVEILLALILIGGVVWAVRKRAPS